MYRLVRLSPVMFLIFVMSGIIAVIAAYVPNYEKKLYEKTSDDTIIVGYPAGDNISRVASVEDINKSDVFTVKIKGEDIKELGIYEKNMVYHKYYYLTGINHLKGEDDRIFNNFNNVSYSEYCILTLTSGEKIIALIDINLLNIKKNEYIILPIGTKSSLSDQNLILDIKARSEISDENTKWYIDMSGFEWRLNELGDTVSKKRNITLAITFFLSLIVLTFILYKYAEAKLDDKLL